MSVPLDSAGVASGAGTAAGLPAVNQALEPAWVRRGSAATQRAYQSALAFEQTLVEQLSQALTATSGLSGEGAQEGDEGGSEEAGAAGAADSQLSSMLPQALTSGVMGAGGLGLAAQMTRELEGATGAQAGGRPSQSHSLTASQGSISTAGGGGDGNGGGASAAAIASAAGGTAAPDSAMTGGAAA